MVDGEPYDHAELSGGSTGRHPFERGWKQSQDKLKEAFADVQFGAMAAALGVTRR